jgi:hypothetical protein
MTNLLTGAWMGNDGSIEGNFQVAYIVGRMSPFPESTVLQREWHSTQTIDQILQKEVGINSPVKSKKNGSSPLA